ncbi:MAG: hydrogenase expression/formation protein [Gammaproteobacteria bacterium]
MKLKDIPVIPVGPGSQPEESDGQSLSYIDMPSDMAKFERPQVPDPESVAHLAGARDAMNWLRKALAQHGTQNEPQLANLSELDAESRELVNQILGEGEVSLTYTGAVRARMQESVLAGVWRTLYLDQDDNVTVDLLEVADVPHLVHMPDNNQRPVDIDQEGAPADVMNAMPILAELETHCERYTNDQTPHVVNLTLLPLSDADVEFLDARLGRGPVDVLSRGYGKCQIISTQVANVWWVRYYNSMNTLILNTIEVVDVPQVLRAAPEDLDDSANRLEEIIAPYWSDVA